MNSMLRKKLVCGALSVLMTASVFSVGAADSEISLNTENTLRLNSFEENAPLTLERLNSISIGTPNPDGGVAEIVTYNSDRKEAYVVNGQDGLLYRFNVTEKGLEQTGTKDMRGLIDGFAYGDMTSVAVDTVNDRIAVALQAENYMDSGRIVLLDYDFGLVESYEVGVQPDMVTFTPDGSKILSAEEGEPREGYGEGITDPAGSVSIVDLSDKTVTVAGFEKFDSAELAANGILIGKVNGKLNDAAADLEPEYIAVTSDSKKAYVSLQEANAIATVDLETKKVTAVKSMGFKDLSIDKNAVDLTEDGKYAAKTYPGAVGVYMPDAVSLFETNGVTYIVTANEGDAREWGKDETEFVNETKVSLEASDLSVAEKVRVLDKDCTSVPDAAKEYLFGGRSFAIYNADTMEQVYESGNDFEKKTAVYLPEWFNCSNDNIDADDRSAKKGPEAESVTVGRVNGRTFAFVALERIGGVMVYDVTEPAEATYVNYINTRDFSADIKEDVSPEGLYFIESEESPALLAACEVSGTVAAYSVAASFEEVHNFVETERVEPTEEREGYVKYVCSICGEEKTEVLFKLSAEKEENDIPQTGESAIPNKICAVMFASALCAAVLIIKKRIAGNK